MHAKTSVLLSGCFPHVRLYAETCGTPPYLTTKQVWQTDSWHIGRTLSVVAAVLLLIFGVLWLLAKRRKTNVREGNLAEETLSMVSRKLIEAHEEERAWLARELHDDVSQRLCLLLIRLRKLRGSETSLVELTHGLEHAIQEVSNLATDVRGLSHRLHSSKLEFLGLATAAAHYCEEVADQHTVQIHFRAENMPRDLSAEISLSIFRVLQEALQNAIKHSGSQSFEVLLNHNSNGIHLTVHDPGRGFDAAQAMKGRGLGLTSMKERVALVGGELSIESQSQNGTTVYVRVPLPP